jgi:type VI secretion system secreted protein Hcp
MSLPAYLLLYDEHGMLVQGDCMMPGREVLSKS